LKKTKGQHGNSSKTNKALSRGQGIHLPVDRKEQAGKDRSRRAASTSEAVVNATLRRQGILVTKVSKQRFRSGGRFPKRISRCFTRQLATMMKSGVPLLQTFDIVGRGHDNPAVGKLLLDIKSDVETGSSLSQAFRKFPLHFDQLYCNLVAAGEQAGILETLLDRLATYKEKDACHQVEDQVCTVLSRGSHHSGVRNYRSNHDLRHSRVQEVFTSFGADLPTPTLMVIAISDFFVEYWWAIFGSIGGGLFAFFYTWKRSEKMQFAPRPFVSSPSPFRPIIRKSVMARWTRTLATMFAAGVPLVESLDSVGGAAGNYVYKQGTRQIQGEVSTGTSLTSAMQNTNFSRTWSTKWLPLAKSRVRWIRCWEKLPISSKLKLMMRWTRYPALMEPIIMVVLGTF
jgi:type IV pilus assembly protein PilC